MIVNLKLPLKSESDQNQQSKLASLKSELTRIRCETPNRISLPGSGNFDILMVPIHFQISDPASFMSSTEWSQSTRLDNSNTPVEQCEWFLHPFRFAILY